jgi:hypothetical protein
MGGQLTDLHDAVIYPNISFCLRTTLAIGRRRWWSTPPGVDNPQNGRAPSNSVTGTVVGRHPRPNP